MRTVAAFLPLLWMRTVAAFEEKKTGVAAPGYRRCFATILWMRTVAAFEEKTGVTAPGYRRNPDAGDHR
jgi:hypothetical protein